MTRMTFASEHEQTVALIRPAADDRAPGKVREWAKETLARWGLPALADDLNTVLTELVTNAWQAGAGDLLVLLEPCQDRGLVDVAVWDDAPGVPVRREPDFVAESGRGLHLVEALTTAWGVEPDPGGGPGKTVWASLRVPGDGDAS
ncbi:Anti-sigma regulatory factor (Ser/Thr protein kinase) [Thermomonospora echinospora]|uniref:Anti-sigma regulatory factor (Ser/Thr protein kinase) n=1 Tax=Thermomonospora echinospora TaxID=1992 RepID=A0A1H5VJB9_9ACTN|nr:ATP-binding protein [Thermomonospora echinospora]SEF86647.1 Anti-sigma regulatory factor (Ser/Thr protein kinase) [Thermomonospora echinospora]